MKFATQNSNNTNSESKEVEKNITTIKSNGKKYDQQPPMSSEYPTRTKEVYTSNSAASEGSSGSKKLFKWHLWWDGVNPDIKVPMYRLPHMRSVPSKIGSLENLKHLPGGGRNKVLSEKLKWKKVARTENLNKSYKPSGGDVQIKDEKLSWNVTPKIGSLEYASHRPGGGNTKIVDQKLLVKHIRPRIDSGFIYEEFLVSGDYVLSSARPNQLTPLQPPKTASTNNNFS